MSEYSENDQIHAIDSDFFEMHSLPQIFKLNIDCFDKLFEWLSLGDLRALRQTCKRLKQVVNHHITLNYPLAFKKLSIRDFHLEYFRQNVCVCKTGFEFLIHIDFLTNKLTPMHIDDIKQMLNRIESINIESMQIQGEFYDTFLRFCQSLKSLSISKFRSGKIIGTGNEWLLHKYTNLECIMFNSSCLDIQSETPELKTFLEINPQIHTISITFEFLWVNRHWMLNSSLHLDRLIITGACNSTLNMDVIWNLLQEFHHRHFFKRLHISVSWIENNTDIHQIMSLNGLERLSLKSISIKIDLPQNNCLKQLNIYAYEYFADFQVYKLIGLEQIYMAYATINDILPFLSYCAKLKQIIVNHLECQSSTYFKNGIINLTALNEERIKLSGARKTSIYVNEKLFLTHKWTTNIHHSRIELKRIQTCTRDQLFW